MKEMENTVFLEALLSQFKTKDILIIDKSTPLYIKDKNLTKERKQYFRSLLKTAEKKKNRFGYYWEITKK